MILVSFFKVSNFICFLNLQEEMMEMQKNQVVFWVKLPFLMYLFTLHLMDAFLLFFN